MEKWCLTKSASTTEIHQVVQQTDTGSLFIFSSPQQGVPYVRLERVLRMMGARLHQTLAFTNRVYKCRISIQFSRQNA